jgi:hypothetical protein
VPYVRSIKLTTYGMPTPVVSFAIPPSRSRSLADRHRSTAYSLCPHGRRMHLDGRLFPESTHQFLSRISISSETLHLFTPQAVAAVSVLGTIGDGRSLFKIGP